MQPQHLALQTKGSKGPDSLRSRDQSDGMKGGEAILWGFRCRLSLSATKSRQSDLLRLRTHDMRGFPNKMGNLPSLMEDLSVTFHNAAGVTASGRPPRGNQ